MSGSLFNIRIVPLFTDVTIEKNGTSTSKFIDLKALRAQGDFGIEAIFNTTQRGTLKIEYLMSVLQDGTYVCPERCTPVIEKLQSGTKIVRFSTQLMPFMKIKVTEDGGIDSTTIESMKLVIQ